ncbi:MAG TPA: carboxylating nicotinate-nucleotide diphosphorylase [Myxococcota bacterium]|nr:carboxylating nicotinate-nucleotide diphosphorylase [Myxococcota bacterium]
MHASLPHPSTWEPLIQRALAEDLGSGDVTSNACLPASLQVEAEIEARAPLVVCGLEVAAACFAAVDPRLDVAALRSDGDFVTGVTPLMRIRGGGRSVFAGERIALNFLGRLCGVASLTRRYVEAVAGTGARILDTRKTLPGWRALDKYAVAVGGGTNHRFGLYDAVLIKDNHIAAAGGVAAAVKAARAGAAPHLAVQCEVESLAQAEEALEAGAQMLLLDNRTPAELREYVARFGERASLEASGGVTLANVRAIAESGVHRISVGALTHSATAADVALEVRARKVGR